MRRNKVVLFVLMMLAAHSALAMNKDEFGEVVDHIESHYHVHRNFRFMMGFAGMVVNVSHIGGVKTMKMAIFEDQQLRGSGSDNEFDEVMRKTLKSGWRPVVHTYSRRTGEHTYIYARSDGHDLKVLLANVEPNEAVVMQLKVDPDKLEAFINEHSSPGRHHHRMKHKDDDADNDETAKAAPAPQRSDEGAGQCFR
ncbi:MAG: hypothetical protein LAP21_14560 [Acidobacteriia bacterium]|nr:hypothetical protein [Terriglobia bacterium]